MEWAQFRARSFRAVLKAADCKGRWAGSPPPTTTPAMQPWARAPSERPGPSALAHPRRAPRRRRVLDRADLQPAPTAARPGLAHPGRVRTRLHHQHRRRPGSMISPQPPSSEAAAVPQVVCLPATGFWPYVRAPDQAERRVPVIFKVRSGGVSFSRRCLLSCEAPACAGRAPASRATSRTPDATSGGPGQRLAHEPRAESSWGSPAAPGRARRGRPRPARGRG